MTARILFVDDEPNVVAGLERTFGGDYAVATATSGDQALATLRTDGPFTVVVSDMRMPGMTGVALFAQVRAQMPDVERILLTGQADTESAISAVNDGHVFRFLTKPCPGDVLRGALEAAIAQHRLRQSERELLEQTLAGATRLLTDILALSSPQVFMRTQHIRDVVRHIAVVTGCPERWMVELAASLCYLGLITLPDGIIHKVYAGQRLSRDEQAAYDSHPETAARLIEDIPRLRDVATIVRLQRRTGAGADATIAQAVAILQIAIEVDGVLFRGGLLNDAIGALRKRRGGSAMIDALTSYRRAEDSEQRTLKVSDLRAGMVLDRDVTARNGLTIVPRGSVVSVALIERLQRYLDSGNPVEPLVVRPGSGPVPS